MNSADAISLGITIGLGLLSVGLGVFAIWLSHRLSEQSTTSLDAIRDFGNRNAHADRCFLAPAEGLLVSNAGLDLDQRPVRGVEGNSCDVHD